MSGYLFLVPKERIKNNLLILPIFLAYTSLPSHYETPLRASIAPRLSSKYLAKLVTPYFLLAPNERKARF